MTPLTSLSTCGLEVDWLLAWFLMHTGAGLDEPRTRRASIGTGTPIPYLKPATGKYTYSAKGPREPVTH
jgi:hypothetical protein